MITSSTFYLFFLALIATFFSLNQIKFKLNFLQHIPVVVFIYFFSLVLQTMGLFSINDEILSIYTQTLTNLFPAMFFLLFLQIDIKKVFEYSKYFYIYSVAIVFFIYLSFYVQNVNYNILIVYFFLFVEMFDKFVKINDKHYREKLGCACTIGAKRYWSLIGISLGVSLFSQLISIKFAIIPMTPSTILIAILMGFILSFSPLKYFNGAKEVANSMLYMIVALVGSHAIESI